jgi:hypothetical protein
MALIGPLFLSFMPPFHHQNPSNAGLVKNSQQYISSFSGERRRSAQLVALLFTLALPGYPLEALTK